MKIKKSPVRKLLIKFSLLGFFLALLPGCPGPGGVDIIAFIASLGGNASTHLAASSGGLALRSTDDAATFETDEEFGLPINDMNFKATGLSGLVVGSGGNASRSSDGGKNWSDFKIGSSTLNGLARGGTNSDELWTVGDGGKIFHSTDDNASWTEQTSGTSSDLLGVCFADTLLGWAFGKGGVLLNTTDGGTTWTAGTSGTTQDLHGCFRDIGLGLIVGAAGTVLESIDEGVTFNLRDSTTTEDLKDVDVKIDADGETIAVGDQVIIRSADFGVTWTTILSGGGVGDKSFFLNTVDFLTTGIVYAAGLELAIFRSTDDGLTWTRLESSLTGSLF